MATSYEHAILDANDNQQLLFTTLYRFQVEFGDALKRDFDTEALSGF
jgi:hypothetical protein